MKASLQLQPDVLLQRLPAYYKIQPTEWEIYIKPENLLVSPKDKDTMTKTSSVIYCYRCDKIDCDKEYVGESSRTFVERFKQHLKAPSPVYDHQNNSGHITSVENLRIIGSGDNMARAIKKAIYITVNNSTLNRNIGKYNLPYIWDIVLYSITELKISK